MVIVLIQKIKQIIHEIEFKRADGIFGNDWEIFQGKLECEDIKQGNLGNCYLLSAINAIVAKDPMLIYQLFRTNKNSKNSHKGFEIVLYINGKWQVMIIDDYFVTYKKEQDYFTNSTFPFSRPNKKEL